MEQIKQSSSLNLPPTSAQVRAITKFCMILKIKEPLEEGITSRKDARDLIYQLITKIKSQRKNQNGKKNRLSA